MSYVIKRTRGDTTLEVEVEDMLEAKAVLARLLGEKETGAVELKARIDEAVALIDEATSGHAAPGVFLLASALLSVLRPEAIS